MNLDEFIQTIKPKNCIHTPSRVYVWNDMNEKPNYFATCEQCGTDYSINKQQYEAYIYDKMQPMS